MMTVIVPNDRRVRDGFLPLLCLFILCIAFVLHIRAGSGDAIWPEFVGEDVRSDGNLLVDCSNAENGYVLAAVASPSQNRMKLRVVFQDVQLTYDLDNTGAFEVFPLQLGSGDYEIALYENAGGNKYASGGKVFLTADLVDENAAFLVPNQYVNYTKESPSVEKSDELGDASQEAVYQSVCEFMTNEFLYDYVRAATISPGSLPEVDPCFVSRLGICQDLSAVMVSMLRAQGIPARLVIGYIGTYYHAWTVAVVDGEERFFDPTAAINAVSGGEYTVERWY